MKTTAYNVLFAFFLSLFSHSLFAGFTEGEYTPARKSEYLEIFARSETDLAAARIYLSWSRNFQTKMEHIRQGGSGSVYVGGHGRTHESGAVTVTKMALEGIAGSIVKGIAEGLAGKFLENQS